MITTPSQSPAIEDLSLGERAADTVRQAAHFAHEVRLLKTLAADAAEDGVRAARRTIKQARQAALDARDELTYRVKREPRKAMAVMFGLGALCGLGLGLACRRGQVSRPRSRSAQNG
jgi:hypothetical protein